MAKITVQNTEITVFNHRLKRINMANQKKNSLTIKNNKTMDGFDKEYYDWIAELSSRYRQSQIKAAVKVNSEMLRFYWSVGKDIEERQFENKYGSHFYETLSRDLTLALNSRKGFAPTSLKYTKYFYTLYSPLFENRRQLADDLEMLFSIPWTHYQKIIDKVKGNSQKALFDFPDIGQLAGYTAMVDDLLNTTQDNPSIGLLICKEKNSVLARYALSRVNAPIGISKYELSQQSLSEELQDKLPTEKEIENGLKRITKKK